VQDEPEFPAGIARAGLHRNDVRRSTFRFQRCHQLREVSMRIVLVATLTLAAGTAYAQVNPSASEGTTQGQAVQGAKESQAVRVARADCMRLWEPATHMSKEDWARSCRRVEGRLQEIEAIEGRTRQTPPR
jgi:hypothetical protein